MQYEESLTEAKLLKRYKRFLADIELPSGEQITIHCPNTGSMKNCCDEGSRVWYSWSDNKKRKYAGTWELVEVESQYLAGINTHRANALVEEAIKNDVVIELTDYENIRREVKYGKENSRIDFLLTDKNKPDCYVEVKSVTLLGADNQGLFPDAVTARGAKHLRELIDVRKDGARAVLLFCVQHTGICRVSPADDIDPGYGELLRKAVLEGVEVFAYAGPVTPEGIVLNKAIPVEL